MFPSTSKCPTIQAGDLVILYYGKDNITSVTVEPGNDTNSRYGHFKHNDMLGVPFGSKFPSSNGRGFVYLLKPTPELWTQALPHRTQILYLPDIAFICSYLNVRPGTVLVEAGTGSGSFSHSVARTVGRSGRLHSFEFHEERYNAVKTEFTHHGLDQISLQHRNVCKDGFPESLHASVDAVFLDLPAPWEAVEFAKKVLKRDRPTRICCFSPCIEQVIRTVTSLGAHGFSEITMYEALTRQYEAVSQPESGPPTVKDIITKLKMIVERKESRRLKQIETAKARKAEDEEEDSKNNNLDVDMGAQGVKRALENGEESASKKVKKGQDSATPVPTDVPSTAPQSPAPQPNGRANRKHVTGSSVFKPLPQLRGHTSYLTFATLMPAMECVEGVRGLPEIDTMSAQNGLPQTNGSTNADSVKDAHSTLVE